MPRNAIVVGMPRSGTSLAAAVFARKGYYVGGSRLSYVREGDDHNPFGYFEADDLIEANVQVFQSAGYSCHNTWLFDPISSEAVDRIMRMPPQDEHRHLAAEYQKHAPWMWKDPRLCFTLAYWWRLIDPDQTGVLLVRRDSEDIYRSFRRKGWCPSGDDESRQRILDRVAQHMAAATRAIDSLAIPHVVVDYEDYERNPAEVARRLGEFFDIDLSTGDLNFHSELNHSSRRGRIAAYLRRQLTKLPRRPVRTLERLVPRRLLALVFPERRFTDGRPTKR